MNPQVKKKKINNLTEKWVNPPCFIEMETLIILKYMKNVFYSHSWQENVNQTNTLVSPGFGKDQNI